MLPGNNQVVILSYGLWQRRYGGDTIDRRENDPVNDKPMTVVGVMPASFDNAPAPTAKIWRVLGYLNQPYACRTCHHLRMIARIRPGVSLDAAQTELDGIKAQLATGVPEGLRVRWSARGPRAG